MTDAEQSEIDRFAADVARLANDALRCKGLDTRARALLLCIASLGVMQCVWREGSGSTPTLEEWLRFCSDAFDQQAVLLIHPITKAEGEQ